jgi:hypothetical protein
MKTTKSEKSASWLGKEIHICYVMCFGEQYLNIDDFDIVDNSVCHIKY